MNRRPTDDDLRRFLHGELPEDEALKLAQVIDAQPLLARRLRQLDPLDHALELLPAPPLPADLIDAILHADAGRPPSVPRGAWVAGLSLLGLASALALIGSDPLGLIFDLADAAATTPALLGAISPTLISSLSLLLAAMLFVAASGVALSLSRRGP